MTLHRALGWRQDAEDPRDRKCEELFRSTQRPPPLFAEPDLTRFRGPRYFQGPVSSCVAHALKRASRRCDMVAAYISGRNLAANHFFNASARFMYWTARQQAFAGMRADLVPMPRDSGCYPRLAMEAVRKVGICVEEACPYDLNDVDDRGNIRWLNAIPPPRAFQHAYDQIGLVYQRIDSVGGARVVMVEDCLRAGWPVIFGMSVDKPFLHHVGSSVISSIDPNLVVGGHMLEVEAVFSDGAGSRVLRFDNWWEGFGDADGKGLMTSGLFGSDAIRDVYAIKSKPIYTELVA